MQNPIKLGLVHETAFKASRAIKELGIEAYPVAYGSNLNGWLFRKFVSLAELRDTVESRQYFAYLETRLVPGGTIIFLV